MVIVYLLMALVGAAAAIFALQNVDPVVIRFLGWRIEGAPLAMVIMLSVLAGIVLTALIGLVQQWKLRSRIRQLEQRLAPGLRPARSRTHDPSSGTAIAEPVATGLASPDIFSVSSFRSISHKALGNLARVC